MSAVRIRSVEATVVTDPAALAPAGSSGTDTAPRQDWTTFAGHPPGFAPDWPDVVCVVTATDGTWGMGMTTFGGPVVPVIDDHLAGVVVDQLVDPESIHRRMRRACGAHYGSSGLAAFAISAVDLAVWDLVAKLEDEPVHALLGGARAEPLPAYATGLAVGDYLDLGFEAFKLPCPWEDDWDDALAGVTNLVHSTRSRVGPDALLMLDGWGLLSPDRAAAVATSCADADLHWLEDAVDPEAVGQSEDLRRRLPGQRLAAGERWTSLDRFRHHIESGLVDVVQPDALWVGGVTTIRQIAAMAESTDVGLSLHCGGNDPWSQHLAVALPGQGLTEVFFGGPPVAGRSTYRSIAGGVAPEAGKTTANNGPGFGIELTLTDIERATS